MKYKITKKQQNSKSCIVCGLKNELSLRTSFYELENGELIAFFKTLDEHQSYPGRLHGGITAAILDETIGRAIMISNPNVWGVTVELNIKYKKPIPLDAELRAVGRITKDTSRIFEGAGEILLDSGEIAATAYGKYLKMPIDKIAAFDETHEDWRVHITDNEPEEVEL
ncbi:MAG: PaaI family thioesterase [Bacillota bacterium]